MCYQRTKDFERLSFLYLITGNTDKLAKMLKIAEMRGDALSRFHNALYLGNARERVAVLAEAGQSHGLEDLAEQLKALLGDAVPAMPCANPSLLYPPLPILRESNWPQLTISKDFWENVSAADKAGGVSLGLSDDPMLDSAGGNADVGGGDGGGWGGDDLDLDLDGAGGGGGISGGGLDLGGGGGGEGGGGEEGGGWGDDGDLDLPDVALPSSGAGGAGYFAAPNSAPSVAERWSRESPLAADHFAAGSFDTGIGMLQRQLGLINFTPLKPFALALASSSHALAIGPVSAPSVRVALTREGAPAPRGGALPMSCITLPLLVERLRLGIFLYLF
ncbi:COPI alpha subunit C-terminus-domain-containing protein [Pavlovales sp. CCMP2436]|nr:COPI alpha subunit C-terminus-domain-containing protein [Pavlovales sp. CCMP2436]